MRLHTLSRLVVLGCVLLSVTAGTAPATPAAKPLSVRRVAASAAGRTTLAVVALSATMSTRSPGLVPAASAIRSVSPSPRNFSIGLLTAPVDSIAIERPDKGAAQSDVALSPSRGIPRA